MTVPIPSPVGTLAARGAGTPIPRAVVASGSGRASVSVAQSGRCSPVAIGVGRSAVAVDSAGADGGLVERAAALGVTGEQAPPVGAAVQNLRRTSGRETRPARPDRSASGPRRGARVRSWEAPTLLLELPLLVASPELRRRPGWFQSVPMVLRLFMLRRISRPSLVMFLGVRRISSSGMSLSGDRSDTLVPYQMESLQVLEVLEVGQPRVAHLRVAQDENGQVLAVLDLSQARVAHLRVGTVEVSQRHPIQWREVGHLRAATVQKRQLHALERRQVGYRRCSTC